MTCRDRVNFALAAYELRDDRLAEQHVRLIDKETATEFERECLRRYNNCGTKRGKIAALRRMFETAPPITNVRRGG